MLPSPTQAISVAFICLHDDILSDINVWRKELLEIDSGTYNLRGLETIFTGVVTKNRGKLKLAATLTRSDVVLNQFRAGSKLEWNNAAKVPCPLTQEGASAYT